MIKVAVFRSNVYDGEIVMRALRELPLVLTDVYSPRQIELKAVTDDGSSELIVNGKDVQSFDALLFINVPYSLPYGSEATEDVLFLYNEFAAAFISALYLQPRPVLNSGFAFCHSRILLEESYQRRVLSDLGWHTPTSRVLYDLKMGSKDQELTPDPWGMQQYSLMLTPNRWILTPYLQLQFQASSGFEALLENTQLFMRRERLDWATISLFQHNDNLFATGLMPLFPFTASCEDVRVLLMDRLF